MYVVHGHHTKEELASLAHIIEVWTDIEGLGQTQIISMGSPFITMLILQAEVERPNFDWSG